MALSSARKADSELSRYENMTEGYEDVFDFFLSVLRIQNRAYRESSVSFPGKAGKLRKRLEESRRLVRPEEVSTPRSGYIECLEGIQAEMKKRWTGGTRFGLVSDLEELSRRRFSGFIRGMASGKGSYLRGLPARTRIKKDTLRFTLESAATPFMSRLSSDVSKRVELSLWQRGTCPVCGRLPVIARLRQEDGARFLYCGFCTTEWRYPRLKCVNCGNEDQFTMRYFFCEDDRGHRVDVCELCKRSIRTTDERVLGRAVVCEVENWVTSFLNDRAKREGYKPTG
ncbi:MAG: formate dehydrogenase accessory protein FdhE [bacterium]